MDQDHTPQADMSHANIPQVIIYSSPPCHFCHMAKDFFKEHGVAFTDYDISENQEKLEEMREISKQMAVPVIRINDDVVIGFDEVKLRALLNLREEAANDSAMPEDSAEAA